MAAIQELTGAPAGRFARRLLRPALAMATIAAVAASAVLVKEHMADATPLAAVRDLTPMTEPAPEPIAAPAWDPETRWFNGRPVRPARTIRMPVTAYSPDARSCGKFADGRTATLHAVETNAMRLVAADTSVLPFGSMLSIEGYDEGNIVPVLDRGGAIKGNRLDVLYPTHEAARQWGVRTIDVVVWEYADGLPADNPRALR